MGKRSDFPRRKMDAYDTPYRTVLPLLPFLVGIRTFAEPCAGNGYLIRHLEAFGLRCVYSGDIQAGQDALFLDRKEVLEAGAIITNPPWTREILHPLILRFMRIKPTWLLFDADWMHCRQAKPYLRHCVMVVSVGRVKWIPDSKYTGKENAAWYLFDARHALGPRFYGQDWDHEVAA